MSNTSEDLPEPETPVTTMRLVVGQPQADVLKVVNPCAANSRYSCGTAGRTQNAGEGCRDWTQRHHYISQTGRACAGTASVGAQSGSHAGGRPSGRRAVAVHWKLAVLGEPWGRWEDVSHETILDAGSGCVLCAAGSWPSSSIGSPKRRSTPSSPSRTPPPWRIAPPLVSRLCRPTRTAKRSGWPHT